MNLLFILVIAACHVARGVDNFDVRLFGNESEMNIVGEIFKSEIRLAVKLYKAAANTTSGYFAIPPADAFVLFSELLYGAQQLSRRQLINVLNYSPESCTARLGLQELVYMMNRLRRVGASMNNEIFHAYESSFEPSFLRKLDIVLRSAPQRVESWEEITNGSAISSWISNAGIDITYLQPFEGEKSLCLVSAAKFTGRINMEKYDASIVRSTFYFDSLSALRDSRFIKIAGQLNYGEFNYGPNFNDEETTAQYIELPWANDHNEKIKTFIILPKSRGGIAGLEENINETIIHEILSGATSQYVIATIPENLEMISVEKRTELDAIQLTEMFNETNDFEKIIPNHPMKVGPFLYQVEIDHEWMNVSKSSEPMIQGNSSNDSNGPKKFNADHTFMMLIVHQDENSIILAMGRYGWKD